MRTAVRRSIACLGLAASLLGACTDDGSPEDRLPGATATTAPTDGETDGTPEADPTTPAPIFQPDDKVLNVAISEPSALDPMRIGDPGSVLVARQIYEGLTAWNPELERVEPAAAESWKVSGGGRVFTFKLRQGMTYHDGRPVRAQDFVFAFDRLAQKRNASEIAYALDRVEGFTEVNQLGRTKHLAGLSAPNDLTLRIRLSEPYQDFPAVLTHPSLVPLQKRVVQNIDRFLSTPVGNGPFRIAQPWSPGEAVLLQQFPGFVDTPELDGIRFIPYQDAATSWLQFIDGQLHLAEVPVGQVEDAAQRFGEAGYQPLLAGYYLGFNVDSRALQNRRMRKAISRAIDREAIAGSIYKDTMEMPRGIVPQGMPGFQENACGSLCRYNKSAAKKLVKEIAPKKRRVSLAYTRGDVHDDVARMIRKDLQAVGLKVDVRGFGLDSYVRRLRDGKQQVYRLGWIAEYPSPDVFLTALFRSTSPDNHSGFASKKVDKLLNKAHRTASPTKRLNLYAQAERAILQEVPIAPIGSFVTRWAAQPTVQNIAFDVMGGFDAVHVDLAEEEDASASPTP